MDKERYLRDAERAVDAINRFEEQAKPIVARLVVMAVNWISDRWVKLKQRIPPDYRQ